MRTKALIFGGTGQVGRSLCRRMPCDFDVVALARSEADLADPEACARLVEDSDADVVIITAAYTAVDQAETEVTLAHRINAAAPAAIAAGAAARDLPVLHISTDYVFDGTGTAPFIPNCPTRPMNVYGHSKLAGESAVVGRGERNVVLRTSWVFSADRANFVKSMLRIGHEHGSVRVVADQVGGPTSAADIADALYAIARRQVAKDVPGGVYHYSGTPDVSWAAFAREIYRQAGMDVSVSDIPSAAWPTVARRPRNSRLDCRSLFEVFGIVQPDWRRSLATVLDELGERRMAVA